MNKPLDQWRGEFGDAYIGRNQADDKTVRQRMLMWGRIVWKMQPDLPQSIMEVGCNIGINTRALAGLVDAELYAIEPNDRARKVLLEEGVIPEENLFSGDGKNLPLEDNSVDLSFTVGVLIHVHPDDLQATVDELHRVSRRYIFIAEYFADQPETKTYHGQEGLLYKRDFGQFMLDRHPDLIIVDHGVFWKSFASIDNSNWTILRKPD